MISAVKRLLIGRPLRSSDEAQQRLTKRIALPVFSSDAISSTAYATEEILHVLVPVVAMAAIGYLLPISAAVMVLLVVVATSYSQTIHAYPSGGGAYSVARENLGTRWSLVAGASLLVDYTLTVAVSTSAGVAAVVSAFPSLLPLRVPIALLVLVLLTLANLRGAREAGTAFAIPTYAYVVALAGLVGYGLWRTTVGGLGPLPVDEEALATFTTGNEQQLVGLAGVLIVARAFSSGAIALTGTEAIANGVPAFEAPQPRNASRTLGMMALILGGFFFGISLLAQELRPTLQETETILSEMGGAVFGYGTAAYYFLQFATMAILFLATNTAFAGFPRLASIVARDGYMPRQLATRGDRLVFSNGVVALSLVAAVLLVAFGGITTALIPLYAVGVFTGFTVSQLGMVRHHRRERERGWRRGLVINAVGAVATGVVLVLVVVSKFTTGAWIPVVVIPLIILLMRTIRRHYDEVRQALRVPDGYRPRRHEHTVIVLVSRVHRGTLNAIEYARSLAPDHVLALSVVTSDEEEAKVRRQWARCRVAGIRLEIIDSEYRELVRPVLDYIDRMDRRWHDDIVTVVVPEFVVDSWWESLLHNQSALLLKSRLRLRPNTVVTSVPLHLDPGAGEIDMVPPAAIADRAERPQAVTGTRPGASDTDGHA